MPKDQVIPREFEPEWLEKSLDRYYAVGLVLMVLLIAAFPLYRAREPHRRSSALAVLAQEDRTDGATLFAKNCAKCHGAEASGGQTAPTLHAKQFLSAVTDEQIALLVRGGITGSAMPAWSSEFGGPLTDQEIQKVVAYLRTLEKDAPSIPDWRQSARAK